MAALKYWLWLTTAPGLSNRTKLLLLEHFSSPEDVYYAQPDELCLVEGVTKQQAQALADKSLTRAETVLADCAKDGQFIVTMERCPPALSPEMTKLSRSRPYLSALATTHCRAL